MLLAALLNMQILSQRSYQSIKDVIVTIAEKPEPPAYTSLTVEESQGVI